MKLSVQEENTGGELLLFKEEAGFDRQVYQKDRHNKFFTIAWNPGESQTVTIDGTEHEFPADTLLTLLFNQSFNFENAAGIIAWQFNREFYCIIDNDHEASCVGFLFSSIDHMFIQLDEQAQSKLKLLSDIFIDELKTTDHVQNELLLALLKRLIVYVTRLAKLDYIPRQQLHDERFHTIRKFNLLVEAHFKTERSVSFYADLLHRSPKTLSNLFALFNQKTPLQIIHERVMVEARRLLLYTSKSVKQVTYELGFEDVSNFSAFFKKNAGVSPTDFKNGATLSKEGK